MSIKIHSNSLKALRAYFSEKLKGIYPPEEIDAFFFLGLQHYLSLSKMDYMLDTDKSVSESDILRIRHLAKELQKEVPIQYILGVCEFMDLKIEVNQNVLIPRQETEEIVADIYSKVKEVNIIIDLCTGSGCIALALKKEYSSALVSAVDLSSAALQQAKKNAKLNSLEVDFKQLDVLSQGAQVQSSDLIVSNPPYVLESEKKEMKKNVLAYEPEMALFVEDNDPLIFYKAIIKIAVEKLNEGGWLFMEINEKFGKEIKLLLEKAGIDKEITINKDLSNKDRWISAKK